MTSLPHGWHWINWSLIKGTIMWAVNRFECIKCKPGGIREEKRGKETEVWWLVRMAPRCLLALWANVRMSAAASFSIAQAIQAILSSLFCFSFLLSQPWALSPLWQQQTVTGIGFNTHFKGYWDKWTNQISLVSSSSSQTIDLTVSNCCFFPCFAAVCYQLSIVFQAHC